MMEHDERVCPGCGESAANYRFCPSCGMSIGSLSESPTRGEWTASDARQEPAQPVTFGGLSSPEANGAGEHTEHEMSASTVTEVGCDGSPPADDLTEVADATTAAAEIPEVVEVPARAEWETGDASHRPAQAPLPPLTFGRLSAAEANGAGDSFDRSPAEDTVVEPTIAVLPTVEISAQDEWEASEASHQPAEELVPPAAFEPLSVPEANGAREYHYDETSTAPVIEHQAVEEEAETDATVEAPEAAPIEWESGDSIHQHDRSAEEGSAPDQIAASDSPFVSDQPLAEAAQERAIRSSTRQPMAFACLAMAIGLLVLLTSRSLRRRS